MAKKTVLVDDLDETAEGPVDTVPYILGGTQYEIDLNPAHATELHQLLVSLERFTAASRRTAGTGNGDGTRTGYDPTVVRAWAQANGIQVSEKGRIPAGVVTQWRRATAGTESAATA